MNIEKLDLAKVRRGHYTALNGRLELKLVSAARWRGFDTLHPDGHTCVAVGRTKLDAEDMLNRYHKEYIVGKGF